VSWRYRCTTIVRSHSDCGLFLNAFDALDLQNQDSYEVSGICALILNINKEGVISRIFAIYAETLNIRVYLNLTLLRLLAIAFVGRSINGWV